MGGDAICPRRQCECLCMVTLKDVNLRFQPRLPVRGDCLTRAVCHHSSRQFILAQPGQCVEGPAHLECADALVILTFEEEFDPRMRWCLPLERGTI